MEDRKVKSRCIFTHKGKVLLVHNTEHDYYFFPGGSSNSGETPEQTLKREIQEEFGSDVVSAMLVDTLRGVGVNQNETISMFRADFVNKKLYEQTEIKIADMDIFAKWIPINTVNERSFKLFPEYDYAKIFENLF